VDDAEAKASAEIERLGQHPRINVPQHHFSQWGACAKKNGREKGAQNTGLHQTIVAYFAAFAGRLNGSGLRTEDQYRGIRTQPEISGAGGYKQPVEVRHEQRGARARGGLDQV
jgi:hypothetical protein